MKWVAPQFDLARAGRIAPTAALAGPKPRTSELRGLPNFFVIGVPKAGTGSMHAYLRQHPQVYLPRVKEVGFFYYDQMFERGLDAYARDYFRTAEGFAARGEATPTYLLHPFVADRIEATLPATSHRFIVLVRDPVARAYSFYRHMVLLGYEHESFERALELEPRRLASGDHPHINSSGYVYQSMYGHLLTGWINRFGRDHVLILFQEDLDLDPGRTLGAVWEFLGIESASRIDARHRRNVAGTPRLGIVARASRAPGWVRRAVDTVIPLAVKQLTMQFLQEHDRKPGPAIAMDPTTAASLRQLFADDVMQLERLTGRDLSRWKTGTDQSTGLA